MKSFTLLSLAAAALALPQSSYPAGCSPDATGTFQITTVLVKKRDLAIRQAATLTLTLAGGILKDSQGRIGYIAANNQFQFDNPVQPGTKASSGWSICGNGSLALGGSTQFYQCLSGSFYNLYNAPVGAGCLSINFMAVYSSKGGASQIPDGQPQATKPVSQIPDGQPQATTAGYPMVSQIPDGQPQATLPGKPVSQITDGQPQAASPASYAVVSQISDGQPQATKPASTYALVSQISDGQPQATKPASTYALVSQISDGQPQATKPGSALPTFTGGAAVAAGHVGAVAAGVFGLVAFL